MEDFYGRVFSQMKGATRRDKLALRRELENHLADHAAALEVEGVAPEEAMTRAEEAMGDPVEIGRELGKLYSPFWTVLSGLLTVLLILALVILLMADPVAWVRDKLTAKEVSGLEWVKEERIICVYSRFDSEENRLGHMRSWEVST